MQNKAIVARLVGETLPLLEKYRREKAARGPEVCVSHALLEFLSLTHTHAHRDPFLVFVSAGANGHIRGFRHDCAGDGYG
jgi:hypothetical protein